MVSIILMGYGTVGKALVKILVKDKEYFKKNYAFKVKIIAICEIKGCLINENGIDLEKLIHLKDITQSPDWIPNKKGLDVLKELKADIMVECNWTNPKTGEPAYSHIKTALLQKINIASSNKGPFYLNYKELMDIANKNNVIAGIESTVGSAIPCIAAKNTISGTKIKGIRAILNGTSNYILSRMSSENLTFELALKEAQELGYAEADPTLDVEGYDAAGKLVILANVLLNWDKTISDVKISGISKITAQAIELAKKDNCLIKHVAVAEEGRLSVGLQLVPTDSPFAANGSLNVIEIITENSGSIIFIGRGAGGSEAASGILSDIINITKIKKID